MASLRLLAFDHEGHPIQFDTWLDNLQLYLLSDSRDSVSLFDHTCVAAPAPPATAQVPYNPAVARYSSPATAALGRLLLPYLFPELSAFATVEDLVLLVVLRARPCSPSPLAPSYASAAALDVPGAEDVGAACASAKRRSRRGKGGGGGGGGSGGGGGGRSGGGGGSGGGGSGGSAGGSGGFGGGGGGSGGSGGSGSGGSGGGRTGAQRGGSRGGQRQQQQRRSETVSP
ncbi:unnamed protein product [Closterium sp. NIES-54]